MGCLHSCIAPRRPFRGVRVIHMNGYSEDFDPPVTAAEVAREHPKHVLCSSDNLVAFGSNPVRPDGPLQPGRLYYLLPQNVFQAQSSPIDLAALMKRLSSAAASSAGKEGRQLRRPAPAPELTWGLSGTSLLASPMRSRASPWRPELDPIAERSMGRSMHRDAINESMRSSQFEASLRWDP